MFDVLIAGGGLVGASLAVALKPLGLQVALIEAAGFSPAGTPGYDDRTIALSYGSAQIYQGMGLWQAIQPACQPIQQIHISDRGHLGTTRLAAAQEKVPALGYVVPARALGKALQSALSEAATCFMPARVASVSQNADTIEVALKETSSTPHHPQQTLQGRLLVVADGAQSDIRQQLGLTAWQYDYRQSAVIANVSTSQPHNNRAYERFTADGPLALLPLKKGRYSLVWTKQTQQAEQLMTLSDTAFLEQLQAAFGYKQGQFTKVGKRSCLPLSLVKSHQELSGRALLFGNASHAVHPVAGQGLNLSLRDVAVLADLLAQSAQAKVSDVGRAALLNNYVVARRADYRFVRHYTHGLVRLFSNDYFPISTVRAAGLMALERIPLLRQKLARQSMGLAKTQARLARGLPLIPE